MGSKSRHSKEIVSIIKPYLASVDIYLEPFVGGANLISEINHPNRWGVDINKHLIILWKAVSEGWLPRDDYTERYYNYLKKNKPEIPETGYAAFALSYGGKYFGGWCRDSKGKRNYVKEAYNNAVKQFSKLENVNFVRQDFLDISELQKRAVIYCDPPYEGTTKYKDSFNHIKFWDWCREKGQQGNIVFVSEYKAPPDFNCVWSKDVVSSLTKNTGDKKAVERLFLYDNNI